MKLQFFCDYSIIIRSMKKVKHIFSVFLLSFIPQDISYPKLLHTRLLFSIKYFLVIISLFATLFTGVLVYHYSPKKMMSLKNSFISTLSSFPKDVEIKIARGTLDSNQDKPLFLWVYNNGQPLFVFMVHTKDTLDTSHIPLPLVFLGGDKMQITYRGNSFVRPYSESLNASISQNSLKEVIPTINSLCTSALVGIYIGILLLVPLLFIGIIVFFIALSSLFVFLLLRTFIPHIHLKKSFQAGIHGTHVPVCVSILLFALFPTSTSTLIITATLIFVFTLVATYEMYSKDVA